jgi:2,3-bisphosphoglycerate-independent phosphoglycerate mutase
MDSDKKGEIRSEASEIILGSASAMAEAVKASYWEGQTDYHLKPLVLVNERGDPIGRIKDGDSVIFCCRRGEREVQLTWAFVDPTFDEFPRKNLDLTFVMMTLYHEMFRDLPMAFGLVKLKDTLGEVVSQHGLKQLRIAESEKFAHVTSFFNGGNNPPFPGEVDVKVPSPKRIPFEQVPELSIAEVTAEAVKRITRDKYHLIVVNLANGDVIGHINHREANIACAEAVDQHVGALLQAAAGNGYVAVVTADHGVLEEMVRPDGSPSIGHTDSLVPFILIDPALGEESAVTLQEGGKSGDVAPTVLQIMGLPQPEAMTCQSLLQNGPYGGGPRRVVLVILDGWGIGQQDETNPIFLADTPVWDKITSQYPFTALEASGEAVGLRRGGKGNSQAGHMNMAAGRVVSQDDVRIARALKDGSFYENEAFLKAIDRAREKKAALHLLVLLSKKSSHGSVDYPLALLRLAKERNLRKVYIHIIFDGRSTDPGSAPQLLEEFGREMEAIGIGQIVSGMGRGIALDRDKNYRKKTKLAYDALVFGKGKTFCAYPIAR